MSASFGRCNATAGLWSGSGAATSAFRNLENETLKLTIPAHRPIKRSTLAHILKQARITPDRFAALL
jgi:hypothetical protein